VTPTIYKLLGFLFLGLATLGLVLPVLPTTPFLLLSAWLFARSSEKWHRWLLANAVFGPMIRNWEQERCISCRTKIAALTLMVVVGGSSVWLAVEDWRWRSAALILMAIGAVTVLSLRTCPQPSK
jgi:uncharacterized membrane protein YbaN (DUF454 family)